MARVARVCGHNIVLRCGYAILGPILATGALSFSAGADSVFHQRRQELARTTPPPGLDMSLRRQGVSLVVQYDPETRSRTIPLGRLHDWNVIVTTRGGAPFEGTLDVAGDMPLHLHGLPSEPTTQPLGAGRFVVRGLRFHMPGWWKIAFVCKDTKGASETITFDLLL